MAIVHDGFLHVGGAETVLLDLVELYPTADLFIPIINRHLRPLLTKKTQGKIHTTFFSNWPFFYEQASLLKPLLIFYWENLNLSGYDFVISSSHSFNAKLINVPKKVTHLSYVYTPPRYLTRHYNEITSLKNPLVAWLSAPLLKWLRAKDQVSGQKPTVLVAISRTVQARIKQIYHRPSLLIYPPVATNQPLRKLTAPQSYLCFSRLVKQKGLDLAVRTCTKLNLPLNVVGVGPELDNLKKLAGPTINFLGYLNEQELDQIFNRTIGLINCAHEEDFGMVTVEAAARGIPIIAYRSGGLRETVLENVTGVFFNQHTEKSLIKALNKFNRLPIDPQDCADFAQQFSKEIFRKKIVKLVKYLSNHV